MDEKLLSLARSELQTQSPWEGWVQQLKLEDAQLAAAVSVTRSCLPPFPNSPAPQPTEDKVTLVPRKPNWDLKRDAAPKVERLERATQRAVATIVRKKIAASGQAPAASAAVAQVRASAAGVGSATDAGGLDEVAYGMDGAALARAVEGGGRGEGEGEEEERPRGGSKRPRRRRYDSDDEEG
jgi:hypothetical protein